MPRAPLRRVFGAAAVFLSSVGAARALTQAPRPPLRLLPARPGLEADLLRTPDQYQEAVSADGANSRSGFFSLNALPRTERELRRDDFIGWTQAESPVATFSCGPDTLIRHRFVWWHSGAYRPPGAAVGHGQYIYGLRVLLSGSLLGDAARLIVSIRTVRVDSGTRRDPVPSLRVILSFVCPDARPAVRRERVYVFTGDGRFIDVDAMAAPAAASFPAAPLWD